MFESLSSLFYHKQGFHVACAETPRERDLASELQIAKMHHRQMFELELGGIPVHTEYRCLFFLRYEFFKYRNTGVI